MIGRYGTDGLNQFLSMSSIVMLLVSLLTRVSLFTWLGAALLILCYYRSLSRNISKRTTTAAPSAARSCGCPGDAGASRSPARAAAPSSSKRAEPPCSDM